MTAAPRVWTCAELLRLAEKAKAAGDVQTHMLITSGCLGYAPDYPVRVSAEAAAMLEKLEDSE